MPPCSNGFLPQNDDFFISPPGLNMSTTLSASEMQGAVPTDYPSNVPNIAGMQQPGPLNFAAEQNNNMWGPYALSTVDPACISSGPFLGNTLSPQNLANPQISQASSNPGHRRNSNGLDQGLKSYRVKHGQVTPPSDTSPLSNSVQPAVLQSSIEALPKRTTKRHQSAADSAGRGGSVSRASSQQIDRCSTSVEPSFPSDGKQEKTRARNRLAASKCRLKKKEQNMLLEARFKQEEKKREHLVTEMDSLRSELVEIKSELLEHSSCGHKGIQRYIQDMAKKITTGADESLNVRAPAAQGYENHLNNPRQDERFFGFGFDTISSAR
ncbi:hypothetical protein BDW59DRAFT_141689 [Aspergillus cavernicola]|uniref:BZIP domain-containing protein n=1 Tax=Aspergillus cavernicola TaxID=176166 RepID=A0ABR4IQL6_9EURO